MKPGLPPKRSGAQSLCQRCTSAPWVCRGCARRCCEHRCTDKQADGWATCQTCWRDQVPTDQAADTPTPRGRHCVWCGKPGGPSHAVQVAGRMRAFFLHRTCLRPFIQARGDQ